MNERVKGICITLLFIAFLSPDTLFFRLLHMPVWDVLFWRGILVALGVFLFLRVNNIPIFDAITKSGKIGFIIVLFDTASNVFFYSALSLTSVANTLIILSATPIFAAVLGRLFLADLVKMRTWVAMGVVCASVVLLAFGSKKPGNLIGDFLALGAAISLAISLVAIRKCPSLNMTPCVGLANLLTSIIVLSLAHPMIIFASSSSMILLLVMGICSTSAMILLVLSVRYINAAEAFMFMPLETILGSFLVWCFIGEPLKSQTLIAGAIILCTISFYSWREFQESKK